MKKSALIVFILLFFISNAQKNEKYVRIDFSSICCGTPSEKPLMDYIEKFRQQNKWKDFEIWEETGLGDEGEYALFVGIDALKCKKKKLLISGLKSIIANFERNRNNNHDGNLLLGEDLVAKEELIKKRINLRIDLREENLKKK